MSKMGEKFQLEQNHWFNLTSSHKNLVKIDV